MWGAVLLPRGCPCAQPFPRLAIPHAVPGQGLSPRGAESGTAARRARRRIFGSRQAEQVKCPTCGPVPLACCRAGRFPRGKRPGIVTSLRPTEGPPGRAGSGAERGGRSRSSRRVRELRPLPRRERGGRAAGTERELCPPRRTGGVQGAQRAPRCPALRRDGTRPPGHLQNLPCWRQPEREWEGRARRCRSCLPSSPAQRGKGEIPGLASLTTGEERPPAPRPPRRRAAPAGLAGAVTEGRGARPGPAACRGPGAGQRRDGGAV